MIDVGPLGVSELFKAICYRLFPDSQEKVVIQARSKKMLDDKVQETIVSTPPNREAVQAPKSKSPGKKAPIKR